MTGIEKVSRFRNELLIAFSNMIMGINITPTPLWSETNGLEYDEPLFIKSIDETETITIIDRNQNEYNVLTSDLILS